MSELIFTKSQYHLFKCHLCGFIFVHPSPDRETIENYYLSQYYENEERYHRINKATQRIWNHRIETIEKYLPDHKKNGSTRSIIDVGCATGFFLQIAQNKGWDSYGVEHSEFATSQAALRIGEGKVHNVNFQEFDTQLKFSALSAWDVIEHVSDPLSFLKKANSLLQDGGTLAFSTVNTASLNHWLFKQYWRYYTPPEHLSYFNLHNIQWALNQTSFEPLEIHTLFNYQAFVDGIKKSHTPYPKPNPLIKLLLFAPRKLSEWVQQGDIIEIWAKKLS